MGTSTSTSLQTIADQLGVSKQTVSNAFNRPDQLSPGLRARVLDTAQRLGYTGPDPSARALASGRTGVVGVVLTERTGDALGDPAAVEFLIGVADGLAARGVNLLLVSGHPDGPRTSSLVLDVAVDGLILYSLSPGDEHVAAGIARGLPLVTVDQPQLGEHTLVGIDQRRATAALVEHLMGLGHESIAVLCLRIRRDGRAGPADRTRLDEVEFPLTAERLAGVTATGVSVAVTWECPDRSVVAAAVDHVLDHTEATAIVAMSDEFAVAAMERLREREVAVPAQMSVVGVDDAPIAGVAGLTTYRQDHRGKGLAAVDALLDGIPPLLPDAGLVVRGSSDRVRSDARPR